MCLCACGRHVQGERGEQTPKREADWQTGRGGLGESAEGREGGKQRAARRGESARLPPKPCAQEISSPNPREASWQKRPNQNHHLSDWGFRAEGEWRMYTHANKEPRGTLQPKSLGLGLDLERKAAGTVGTQVLC